MTIALNERYEKIIQDQVEAGGFNSPQEVIEAALDQMTDPLAGMSAETLNALIDEGVRDLNEGRIFSAEQVDQRMAATRAAFLARRSAQ